jgi:hypothetical protein
LLRQSKSFAVNFFENNIAAATQKGLADLFSEAHGIIPIARFAQNFCSVGMGYESVQMNAAVLYFRESSDGNLATAAEFIEQRPLAGGGSAGGSVIEKCQQGPGRAVAVADFNSQSALSGSRSHHIRRDDLADALSLAQAI